MNAVDAVRAAELAELARLAAAGLVVIGCGAAKVDHPAPAAKLYTGVYFRSCRSTAAAIAPGRWFILSAKYGLVRPFDVIEPYDLTLGQPGAVGAPEIRRQAAELGIEHRSPVVALCGARYADVLSLVFADVRRPFAGLGIGSQRRVLAELARSAC